MKRISVAYAGMVIAMVVAGARSPSAHATIVWCEPAPGSYTVFLSEPQFSAAAFTNRDQLRAFLGRLQFELDQSRAGGWVDSPSTSVRFVACKRAPELDGREFNPDLVDRLHTNRVLLEIWGQLDVTPAAGGSRQLRAQINYLLVPVQFASNQNETTPRALQRLEYLDSRSTPPEGFVQLIARPRDIDAFVASALGFKLLNEGQRELAHSNLCRANAILEQMTRRKMGAGAQKELKALHLFVLASASRAVDGAQNDTHYKGLLRLQDSKQPCAEAD